MGRVWTSFRNGWRCCWTSWQHSLVSIEEEAAETEAERPRLLARQDELNASPGYRALTQVAHLRRIGYVLQANVAQYNALLGRVQDPAVSVPIFDMANPQAHDDLLSEVERLLHNVLMALSTRIDQQRAFINRHFAQDTALMAEYLAGVKSHFGGYAPAGFLRDLRNYLTHYQLPVAQSEQTLSKDSFSVTFILCGIYCWNGTDGRAMRRNGSRRRVLTYESWN